MDVDRILNAGTSLVAVVAVLAFVASYAAVAPWWESVEGRHIMAMAVVVGALCAYAVVITVWPQAAPVLRFVRSAIVLAVAALFVQRTVLLWRAQREAREEGAG
ncbi:hypothetical protein GCM10027160_23240 [Streptomyces calidiresistens]